MGERFRVDLDGISWADTVTPGPALECNAESWHTGGTEAQGVVRASASVLRFNGAILKGIPCASVALKATLSPP